MITILAEAIKGPAFLECCVFAAVAILAGLFYLWARRL